MMQKDHRNYLKIYDNDRLEELQSACLQKRRLRDGLLIGDKYLYGEKILGPKELFSLENNGIAEVNGWKFKPNRQGLTLQLLPFFRCLVHIDPTPGTMHTLSTKETGIF